MIEKKQQYKETIHKTEKHAQIILTNYKCSKMEKNDREKIAIQGNNLQD